MVQKNTASSETDSCNDGSGRVDKIDTGNHYVWTAVCNLKTGQNIEFPKAPGEQELL